MYPGEPQSSEAGLLAVVDVDMNKILLVLSDHRQDNLVEVASHNDPGDYHPV